MLVYLYEDDDLIVINKPPHIAVHPLRRKKDQTVTDRTVANRTVADPTIAELLLASGKIAPDTGSPLESGLVHRLDNGTSGILVAARNQGAYQALRQLWNTKQVSKVYTALVIGRAPAEGTITDPIAHHNRSRKKMMICETAEKAVNYRARTAETHFSKFQDLAHDLCPLSLLNITIVTGVRHQIRVHLSSRGHPLCGDTLYQSHQQSERDPSKLDRPFLHLNQITLPHPRTLKNIRIKAPLSEDLTQVLWQLDTIRDDINM